MSFAGFNVSRGSTRSGGAMVKADIFFTACASVSVLPARMLVPDIMASPSVTVTGLTPSMYSPSGRPAACMESVMATTLSQPLHFRSMRTVPGWRWRPSQMASQNTSRSSTAPITAGRCCGRGS